jgi:hypothetical protein
LSVDEERLKNLYRAGTEPADRAACPSGEELQNAALGRLSAASRAAILAHAAGCSACADELRLAMELEPWAERAARTLDPGKHRETTAGGWWLAAAAVALLAIGAALALRFGRPTAEPVGVMRGQEEAASAVLPADGTLLRQAPDSLTWAPVSGARAYSVEVFDAESTPLWSSRRLTTPRVDLPPEVRHRISEGGGFLWRVVVYDESGRRDLALGRFVVSPQPAAP